MGRQVWPGLFVLVALAAASCDSDQPLQVGEQNGRVEIIANGAETEDFHTWFLTEDSDADGNPDDLDGDGQPERTLWCEIVKTGSGTISPGNPISVPWNYSLRVAVIPAGETTAQLITSEDAQIDSFNTAPYDVLESGHVVGNPSSIPVSHDRGSCSGDDSIVCNPASMRDACARFGAGSCQQQFSCSADFDTLCDPTDPGTTCSSQGAGVCTPNNTCSGDPGIVCDPTCAELGLGACILDQVDRTFVLDPSAASRRDLTAANRELLEADGNLIDDTCNGDPVCTATIETILSPGQPLNPSLGLCPGSLLGEPAMDPGNPATDATGLDFVLEPGDTVIVEARLSNEIPGGGQVIDFISQPGISARIFIGGAQLQPDEVDGNLASTDSNFPSLSFSFTLQ